MMNPLYSSWNNALDYSRYPCGNTAPTVLSQMHYRYRGSTVHSVPSPRYYREILPIPTVITAVTAVLPHSPLPCHSLLQRLKAGSRNELTTENKQQALKRPLRIVLPATWRTHRTQHRCCKMNVIRIKIRELCIRMVDGITTTIRLVVPSTLS